MNPTNIDVDHKGRVWICEAYNYRPALTGNETKPEGDRILILEDTDGDGNKGVRINYVMEYGNFGYKDEMTNAGWQANRTNVEKEVSL